MGHIEKDELVNVIRHEMRLEDEDGSGLCGRLLLNPTRRARVGGLPLDFRQDRDGNEEDDCYDDVYEIPLYEEPLYTRAIINEHLNERTAAKIKEETRTEDNFYTGPLEELFVKQEVAWPPVMPEGKSVVEKFLENYAQKFQNPLSEYTQFGANTDSLSKTILIVFPKDAITGKFKSLEVSVTCNARVREVVGYIMLQYFLTFEEDLPGEVEDYQLYLAEEDGEIESDFPPLDSSKLIGQLGFECLGLVSRKMVHNGRNTKKAVVVWFLDKDQYVIEIDNMEKPLRWLRDEALRLKMENFEGNADNGLRTTREYYLETVDRFDVKLDLENTISSTRSLEFVMVRKNSSRAGFHPRGARYGRQMSAMLTLKMPNSPIPAAPMTPLPTVVEHDEVERTATAISSPVLTWDDGGGQLSCFTVMRVHRFKPKWKAKLVIRWTCFEVEKYTVDRAAFLPQGYQKFTKVTWEYVGGLRVQQKDPKPGRVDTWQITIFWLPLLPDDVIQKIVGDDEWNLKHIAKLYSTEEKWRSVTIESTRKPEIDEINSQMNSILQARDSSIYKSFMHSSFGTRSPSASANVALMESCDGPLMFSTDNNDKKKQEGRVRKMSRMIMTPISSVMRKKTE